MTDPISIETLEEEDRTELIRLVNSAYRGEGSKQGWTTEADLLGGIRTDDEAIAEQLRQPGARMLVAWDGSKRMAGCVYLLQQGTKLYLGMLTVAPDLQAKGIGKKLLLAAEAFAREKKCGAIVMTVIDVRHELIDWYKRHGYHLTGEKKPFPGDPRFGIPKQPLQFAVLEKTL